MANSLLDFVMSLVRDPDVAARYAADPAQAIADAHLTDVTSADVNNLIPVVSESLSMAAPTASDAFHAAADTGANVWASGAATAAFDAFADHVPTGGVGDAHALVSDVGNVVDQGHQPLPAELDDFSPVDHPIDLPPVQFDAPVIDDAPLDHAPLMDDWGQAVVEERHLDDGGAGFDLFT